MPFPEQLSFYLGETPILEPGRVLPYYYDLHLDTLRLQRPGVDQPSRHAMKWRRLLHESGSPENGLRWWQLLAEMPAKHRAAMLTALFQTDGLRASDAAQISAGLLGMLIAYLPPDPFGAHIAKLLHWHRQGASRAFLRDWCFAWHCGFDGRGYRTAIDHFDPLARFPYRWFLLHFRKGSIGHSFLELAAAIPFDEAFWQHPFWALQKKRNGQFGFSDCIYAAEYWRRAKPKTGGAETVAQLLGLLDTAVEVLSLHPEMGPACVLDRVVELCNRKVPQSDLVHCALVQAQMFRIGGWLDSATEGLSTERLLAMPILPEKKVAQLEKELQRDSAEWNVPAMLLREWGPELFCAAMASSPKHFARVVRQLGLLPKLVAQAMLRRMAGSGLFAPAPLGLVALDKLLQRYRAQAKHLPTFSTWDKHFAGKKVLSLGGIEAVAAQVRQQLPMLRLLVMEKELVDAVVEPGLDEHAQWMAVSLQSNRRALTRFLRQARNGEDHRLAHPNNQAWLRKRPNFPLSQWQSDNAIRLHLDGLGELQIGLEADPFEILRMGTYVRSCTGLGQFNAHNAVSLAMDVNKRVVVCRKADGTFLARQVVAVADTDQLALFAVYPHDVAPQVQELFWQFGRHLAFLLGLPIVREGQALPKISPLVGPRWYDDGIFALQEVAAMPRPFPKKRPKALPLRKEVAAQLV